MWILLHEVLITNAPEGPQSKVYCHGFHWYTRTRRRNTVAKVTTHFGYRIYSNQVGTELKTDQLLQCQKKLCKSVRGEEPSAISHSSEPCLVSSCSAKRDVPTAATVGWLAWGNQPFSSWVSGPQPLRDFIPYCKTNKQKQTNLAKSPRPWKSEALRGSSLRAFC